MRDHLFLYINGEPHTVRGEHAFWTLSKYLRQHLGKVGTKIVCEEGDCGACTVLIGRVEDGALRYAPINSCILHLYQLDCTHVVSVEGVRRNGALSEVQQSMVTHQGAQCGFCTPGFIMAMAGMFESCEAVTEHEVKRGLTGNLCRCTGYEPIIKAALKADPSKVQRMNGLYPSEPIIADLERLGRDAIRIESSTQTYFCATDATEAARFKAEHEGSVIVQGGTDVGVWCNKRAFVPEATMSISRIPGMRDIKTDGGTLVVGGSVTLHALHRYISESIPAFRDILELFGAPQIRHAGTLAGNIANGSPIADSLPFLYVMEADLELTGRDGARRVAVDDFYLGYKSFDLKPDEFIAKVIIPLPASEEILRLYKVSKRRDLDISSFTAAFRMRADGDQIGEISIAYGGVGPVVLRLPETEAFLTGRPISEETFAEAGGIARREVAPISDVRGTAEFRQQLAENALLKFYHEIAEAEVAA
ncbi:xanthine dehydrogenase small subunit [soil metagenome]